MKRKVYEKLLEWKRLDHGTSAVLINGARRVGKSFIAEAFARNEYRNYLLIDFAKAKDDSRVTGDRPVFTYESSPAMTWRRAGRYMYRMDGNVDSACIEIRAVRRGGCALIVR